MGDKFFIGFFEGGKTQSEVKMCSQTQPCKMFIVYDKNNQHSRLYVNFTPCTMNNYTILLCTHNTNIYINIDIGISVIHNRGSRTEIRYDKTIEVQASLRSSRSGVYDSVIGYC